MPDQQHPQTTTTNARGCGLTGSRLPWRAHVASTDKAKPESDRECLSFFRTIEQFEALKSFQHDLCLLTGLPFDFVDLRMRSSDKLQAQRLFTPFCALVNSTHLGRLACERDDQKAASTCLQGRGCLSRRCHLGLIDTTIPIVINGRAVGLLCTGQLLYQQPTQRSYRRIQKRLAGLGVDVAKARQAYFDLPVLEKRRVTVIINFSNLWGLWLKEWTHVNHRTRVYLWLGIIILLISAIRIGIGNNLAAAQ